MNHFLTKCLLTGVLCFPPLTSAATIQLQDGSRITGEVLSMSEGRYTVRSSSLGIIQIKQGDVLSIHNGVDSPAGENGTAQIRKRIAANPALQGSLTGLQNNAQVQAILNDPAIMRAIQAQDLQSLQNDPKIQALMNSPEIRSILEQIK